MVVKKKRRKKKSKFDIGVWVSAIFFGCILLGFVYVSVPSEVDLKSLDTKVTDLVDTAKDANLNDESLPDDWYMDYVNLRGDVKYIYDTKISEEDKIALNTFLVRLDTAYYLLKDR